MKIRCHEKFAVLVSNVWHCGAPAAIWVEVNELGLTMKALARQTVFFLLLLANSLIVCAQTFDQLVAADNSSGISASASGPIYAGFLKLAQGGHAGAQHRVGQALRAEAYVGISLLGMPKDLQQQATAWFQKAADQGHDWAQYEMGRAFETGLGVPKDLKMAVIWYRKAADQGNATAQMQLGGMYQEGRGVPRNLDQAFVWYQKTAANPTGGVVSSMGRGQLAEMYANGEGAPKNVYEALAWYLDGTKAGYLSPFNQIGLIYEYGKGVPKDMKLAAYWYRQGAERGYAVSQFNLGLCLAKGDGVPKDERQAYFWLVLASAQDIAEAKKIRDVVETRLPQEQRLAGQAAAAKWRPKSTSEPTAEKSDGSATPKQNTENADSTGSGFRIGRGYVVTNHHVVNECSRLSVNGVVAQLRNADPRSDLALLSATSTGNSVSLRAQRAAVGESVSVAGFPLHGLLSGFNMTTGNLSSLSGIGGDTRLVQITAPVQPGNSGGPVLDSAGNLMGVVVSKLDAIKAAKITGDIPQNVNFAINANVLRSFLDANSVEYETANSDKALLTTAIADRAKGFTVLVECWK